ncbi:MAG: nickel-dependent lactate racemase [Spirochaetales bacterium]|nr:nickel-dependent lactate racemase [Spirochaetales bacterium]
MKVLVEYNKGEIEVQIPEERMAGLVEPNDVEIQGSPRELLKTALTKSEPESFESFLKAPGKLLVIVNDGTRPTPTQAILDCIADELEAAGAEFIIATGAHRGPTIEEYALIFGKNYERFSNRIYVHDARKHEDCLFLGTSINGTELTINKRGVEAEKLLVIGSVEPHYFAGYTGGRKGILPGIASYRTIEENHRHALHPMAKSLQLEGNPVHEDMMDALNLLDNRIFGIMSVLDKNHQIYSLTAGDIRTSFYDAVGKAEDVFVAPVEGAVEIVVSICRYPMDIDLYQAQKAIDNGKLILKEGGILILVSSCWDGLGDETFIKLLRSSDTPEGVHAKIAGEYRLGYHKAGKMAEVFQQAEVWAMTEVPDDVLRDIFIRPVHNLQEALDEAFKKLGEEARVLFLSDGSVTVPTVKQTIF